MKKKNYLQLICVLLLGISCGIPLALSASTLSAMLKDNGVNLATIGLFSMVAMPYSLKFLWGPIVDNFQMPFFSKMLGRRKGWLVVTQLLLALSIMSVSLWSGENHILILAMLILLIAFFSATQDLIVDALRIEIFPSNEQGNSVTYYIVGYRLGMLISTAGALYFATYFDWKTTYLIMGSCVLIGLMGTFIIAEPKYILAQKSKTSLRHWLRNFFIAPLSDITRHANWGLILLVIVLYKLSDAYIGILTTPFLLEIGFTKIDIANYVKTFGMFATFAGAFLGGYLVKKVDLFKALWLGCLLQILSNFLFVVQAFAGNNHYILMMVIGMENLTGGVGTVALMAYMGQLCNLKFTATQFALLSSFASLARSTLSSSAGFAALNLGWINFFIYSSLLSIPALFLIKFCKKSFQNDKKQKVEVSFAEALD